MRFTSDKRLLLTFGLFLIFLLAACTTQPGTDKPTSTSTATSTNSSTTVNTGNGNTPTATVATLPSDGSVATSKPKTLKGTNLIVNGDAESGAGAADDGTVEKNIPGWTTTNHFTTVQYGASGGFAVDTDPGPQNRGKNFFVGGPETVTTDDLTDNTVTGAKQIIDVSAFGTQLDSGSLHYLLSAYLGGYSSQNDNATLNIDFQNSSHTSLGKAKLGPVLATDRQDTTGLVLKTTTGTVPKGTRYIEVTLTMTKTDASYNDGSADNISLIIQ